MMSRGSLKGNIGTSVYGMHRISKHDSHMQFLNFDTSKGSATAPAGL